MNFDVEVVLKGRDVAVSRPVSLPHADAAAWDDGAVRDVLTEILRAIRHVAEPAAAEDAGVVLQGFSWIVEPTEGKVVIAIEIPMGAAVAGPFRADAQLLTASISRVLRAERQMSAPSTIH